MPTQLDAVPETQQKSTSQMSAAAAEAEQAEVLTAVNAAVSQAVNGELAREVPHLQNHQLAQDVTDVRQTSTPASPEAPIESAETEVENIPIAEEFAVESTTAPTDKVGTELTATDIPVPEQDARSDSYEPPEAAAQDTVDHVAIPDSPPFSPAPADTSNDEGPNPETSTSMPTQISDAPRPRGAFQEIEMEATSTREVHIYSASSGSVF